MGFFGGFGGFLVKMAKRALPSPGVRVYSLPSTLAAPEVDIVVVPTLSGQVHAVYLPFAEQTLGPQRLDVRINIGGQRIAGLRTKPSAPIQCVKIELERSCDLELDVKAVSGVALSVRTRNGTLLSGPVELNSTSREVVLRW